MTHGRLERVSTNWTRLIESQYEFPKIIRIDPDMSEDIFQVLEEGDVKTVRLKIDDNLPDILEVIYSQIGEIIEFDLIRNPKTFLILTLKDNEFSSLFDEYIVELLDKIEELGLQKVHEFIKVSSRNSIYSEFSKMNQRWNNTRSDNLHSRLQNNPEEWQRYHKLYREARENWDVVPFELMIDWLKERDGHRKYTVGDFGCGDAKIEEKCGSIHNIYSFDHVAKNSNVTRCDMKEVPIDDEVLDVAIFCLSLMGSNFTEYLLEAYRVLKIDGMVHIYISHSRFKSDESLTKFMNDLEKLGFERITKDTISKFVYITANKGTQKPQEDLKLSF